MLKIKLYNEKAEVVGEKDLNPDVFGMAINESLVHQAATAQMANERQILAHTKSRAEVRGGGKKPWRQKGTGRARAGSSRSPIWIGGGVTFGPTKDRNFSKKINTKMKKKAIAMVLTDKANNEALIILDKIEFKNAKTKEAETVIKNIEKVVLNVKTTDKDSKKVKRSVLIINSAKDENVKRAFNNIKDVELLNINNINVVDLLKYRNLIATKDAVEKIEKIYGKK
ncbi:50S ribosomal protein L4 [Candidatus Falkowbacteria bacterium CG10_big_fil_rev_8_21_14_0_10_37_6]|uniref:Large ribosomal subunit protein uL4 n=1 Tax=Candidatus Falkowbacteria bacterium CG10_big_fil_rev_8_21_14_0_10_37_6 TaxID=1974563 RepID=A0A2H0V7B9_9BACT|nr:MAG: 50S ribosomal protein L4 [Candidatus Falkowbacteria bacterium CG10_big_fil_rev_8_21_14_0_10_37_6]